MRRGNRNARQRESRAGWDTLKSPERAFCQQNGSGLQAVKLSNDLRVKILGSYFFAGWWFHKHKKHTYHSECHKICRKDAEFPFLFFFFFLVVRQISPLCGISGGWGKGNGSNIKNLCLV